MEVLVIGGSGMLGEAVITESRRRGNSTFATDPEHLYIGRKYPKSIRVINCAGAIPKGSRRGSKMIESNAVLPWMLAEECSKYGVRLIHVSTDCVFSGKTKNPYVTSSVTDATDLYGSSKAIGEKITALGATVVRTSFIGFKHGLMNWLISNRGKLDNPSEVEGYERVLWTGSTVWEAAIGIMDIAESNKYNPIEHLATEKIWNKSQVLQRLECLLDLNIAIKPVYKPIINRALEPTVVMRDLNDIFVATRLLEEWQK